LNLIGNFQISGSIVGNSNNTTEVGTYSTGAIKRVRMSQGGEIHFGDTTSASPLGITEGAWDNFADQDRLSVYYRSSIKFFSAVAEKASIDGSGNFNAAGNVTTPAVYLTDSNTKLHEGSGNALRITTPTGYMDIGSMNSGWIHFQGSLPYYFNQPMHIDNHLYPYSTAGARNIGGTGNIWNHVYAKGYFIDSTEVIDASMNLSNVVTATVNSLHIKGENNTGYSTPGSMLGGLSLWGAGATTSQMMFKPIGSGSLGNHGFCTDSYNTYFVMDTTNRGWVFRNHSTATNVASISNTGGIQGVHLRGATLEATDNLYLNGGNYEGQIVFGAVDAWRCGIRQHDDGDAELRIWAKNANGRVHIATGYDGMPTNIARPTDGFVVDHNNVGIGAFVSSDPSEKLHVIGNMKLTGNLIGNANSATFKANTVTSYGSWCTSGSRGGYDGIVFDNGGDTALMFDSSGNGGTYRQSGGGWYYYFNVANNCMGINESTTSSSYGAYLTGAFYATGNITAYSDRRVKENIVQIDNALEKVNKLEGVYYNRIDDESRTKEIGFIAQDVNEVVPELVTYAEDVDQYGVKYQNATALLVEAVKELTQQVNDLKQEIEEIKNVK
jgi:hypothetical protein